MSSHSGTIGRSRGLSVGSQIRRQRSVEWRHEHGYSSSEDDERISRGGSINPSFDSQLLAQLIAQSQQLSNIENNYRSDGPDDAQPTDTLLYSSSQQQNNDSPNIINRSPLQLRQASPFPMESTNSRRIHYVNPQERLRSSGDAIYASTGKSVPISNSTLLRTGRSARHSRGGGGMTSSSSASSNSNNNLERYRESRDQKDKDDIKDNHRPTRLLLQNNRDEDEPPPEPAPPEIPPRAQSLLASIKKLSSHTIKMDENGDLKHEEFIPSNQHGHSFRRSSATILANSPGVTMETVKRHGSWRSSTVAEGYIEYSLQYKRRTANPTVCNHQIKNLN